MPLLILHQETENELRSLLHGRVGLLRQITFVFCEQIVFPLMQGQPSSRNGKCAPTDPVRDRGMPKWIGQVIHCPSP